MKPLKIFYQFIFLSIFFFIQQVAADEACHDQILPSTPDHRFEIFGDEVKDLKTGLIWKRCPHGQSWDGSTCTGGVSSLFWGRL